MRGDCPGSLRGDSGRTPEVQSCIATPWIDFNGEPLRGKVLHRVETAKLLRSSVSWFIAVLAS